ncbi:MAG: response regulator [Chloroflexi bacterium]|nr:response regulator [Chloroflexota bacterium]
MIVDDDLDICEIVQVNLEGAGFEVLQAHDGQSGLELARQERPDLVILDVLLPRRDGWSVLTTMQADPHLAHTPVLMLTCCSEDDDVLRGLTAGAVEYITKPFAPEQIVASVRLLLGVFDRSARERRRRRLIAWRQRLARLAHPSSA